MSDGPLEEAVETNQDTALDFDPVALREKYRAERDKRLKNEGTGQYRAVDGAFAHLLTDPYVEPGFTREPLTDEVDAVVIGGGFGGLMMAARLREAGIKSVRIIEKGGDFGGTWYWNRYPGAACDIESYVYMPLLEELGYVPTEKYARSPEIFRHSQAIGRHFDLYRDACFQTEVTELRWDEAQARWIVSTDRGDAMKARFVCMSTGPLQRPKLPGIPGVELFKGHTFHTSRWDYAYTGGDEKGGMTGLEGKRVGIIGTGATAIQAVPHLGETAGHLYVFQRTPSSVDARYNRPTDPEWAKGLKPGWQQERMDNFNALVSGGVADEDMVADGWTEILGGIGVEMVASGDFMARIQMNDFKRMERIRARVDQIVQDGATAEALKPYYDQMCKRPCFNDHYLETFNRSNVTLVDTQGQGVEAITERGVVVDGQEYELDCLIYGTGFEFQTDYARRTGYQTYGRDGLTLSEKWQDGVSSLHGFTTRGFPNMFVLGNAQSANTPNFTHMLNEASKHVAHIVKHCDDNGIQSLEPSQEAEEAWVAEVLAFAGFRRAFDQECTPGYYNNEGMPSDTAVRNSFYGGGPILFLQRLTEWREAGTLPGMDVVRA
ncbi:MAG: flavin-containing monooxygenase [Brevundimonas sp.]